MLAVVPVIGAVKYSDDLGALGKNALKGLRKGMDNFKGAFKRAGNFLDGMSSGFRAAWKNKDEALKSLKKTMGDSRKKLNEFFAGRFNGGSNSLFADNITDILKKESLTLDEFNELRLREVSTLSDAEKAILKAIRESVPMPDANTLMQKVIPASNIAKYMDGTYTQVGGFVTRADDVKQLKNYDDIYNSLRLDYPDTAYNIASDDSLAIIRYTTSEPSKIDITFSSEFGGVATGEAPFTGNGFTKATNGQIIPEFKCSSLTKINDGAQLIEIGKDGTETVIAIYDVDFGRFIPVD